MSIEASSTRASYGVGTSSRGHHRPWIVVGLIGCLAAAAYCVIDHHGPGPILFAIAVTVTGELIRRAGLVDDLGRRILGRTRKRRTLILLSIICSTTAVALAVLGVGLRFLWGEDWPAGAAWVSYLTITLFMMEASACTIKEVRRRRRAPVPPDSQPA